MVIKLDFDNNIPIYLQVMHIIKQDIVTGQLKAGDKMPSSREMSQKLGLNFNTVARVYKELEMEGIVYTKRGLGTFIAESSDIIEGIRSDMATEMISRFISGMISIGFSYKDMIALIEQAAEKQKSSIEYTERME